MKAQWADRVLNVASEVQKAPDRKVVGMVREDRNAMEIDLHVRVVAQIANN